MNRAYSHQHGSTGNNRRKPFNNPTEPAKVFLNNMDEIVAQMTRPSVMYQPDLNIIPLNGGWTAKYGDMECWGASPELAMNAFDIAWRTTRG